MYNHVDVLNACPLLQFDFDQACLWLSLAETKLTLPTTFLFTRKISRDTRLIPKMDNIILYSE